MSRSMLRALAITWTIAAVVEIAAAALIIAGDGSTLGLWIAIIVFVFSLVQAVTYWYLLFRRSSPPRKVSASPEPNPAATESNP